MVDTRFAYIEQDDIYFQVLKYDEEGNPYDWDEVETAKQYKDYVDGKVV